MYMHMYIIYIFIQLNTIKNIAYTQISKVVMYLQGSLCTFSRSSLVRGAICTPRVYDTIHHVGVRLNSLFGKDKKL